MSSEQSDKSCKDGVLSSFLHSLEECSEKNDMLMDKVPDLLREQNVNAYTPTTVSIGPLHRKTERLQVMEPVKLSYTRALLARTADSKRTKRNCSKAMLETAGKVRECYEPARLPPWSGDSPNSWLAEVMLIDGCFIIELLLRNLKKQYDPILSNPFKCYAVQRDLLLLENQIPFFVLEDLFDIIVKEIWPRTSPLTQWVLKFFGNIMGIEKYKHIKDQFPFHILHLLHIQYLPAWTDDDNVNNRIGIWVDMEEEDMEEEDMEEEDDGIEIIENRINYSATELRLAGVELKAGKERNLFHIKFSTAFSCTSCSSLFRKGHLEIPSFLIFDSTESFLRNFIAFEQSYHFIHKYFTSFAFLMDILIDTPKDVKLLEEAGIIRNNLGSREEVAQLFNGICRNAIPRRFLYGEQYKDAMNFCNHWRLSTRRVRQYYFGNPWSGISVFAAIILFVLTFLSTLYTMLSYY
ncbi:UPF0481 protein At3g47200-like [Cornus florida]|uniref:UPF0481 protein At3g47200-like n=1 Tax=Cornus florida TaxID=4283 RepID=UPI002896FC98|nr:UPF0481 protein At3g47200-like [Cornus florida]